MRITDLPANLSLLVVTDKDAMLMTPVTSLDFFDGASSNLHDEGLFSTKIFGRVGSEERDLTCSYIDIKAKILHPFFYETLVDLKGLYAGIMAGRAYAIWDEKEKDFLPSDEVNGNSGYSFFMSHWKDIEFKRTGSAIRDERIKLIKKYRDHAENSRILVIPAGIRDITTDENGRHEQAEINDFYRSLMNGSNAINANTDLESTILDTSRASMQNTFNKIYTLLSDAFSGKKGFAQGKWASRNVVNGTRNVITAMDTSIVDFNAPNLIDSNRTVIGIYQMAISALPKTRFLLTQGILANVFSVGPNQAMLIDKKTKKRGIVQVSSEEYDRWTKTDGLDKVIHSLKDVDNRSASVEIEGHYVAWVLFHSDDLFKVVYDIDTIPEEFATSDYHPLTLAELVYLSCWKEWHRLPMMVTRYPVTGVGSIYPSFPFVKTTSPAKGRYEIQEDWSWDQQNPDTHVPEFPNYGVHTYIESMVPHPSRIGGMGADFDGDMCSCNVLYSDDAIKEVTDYLNSTRAYLDSTGSLLADPVTDTVEFVLYNITRPAHD